MALLRVDELKLGWKPFSNIKWASAALQELKDYELSCKTVTQPMSSASTPNRVPSMTNSGKSAKNTSTQTKFVYSCKPRHSFPVPANTVFTLKCSVQFCFQIGKNNKKKSWATNWSELSSIKPADKRKKKISQLHKKFKLGNISVCCKVDEWPHSTAKFLSKVIGSSDVEWNAIKTWNWIFCAILGHFLAHPTSDRLSRAPGTL